MAKDFLLTSKAYKRWSIPHCALVELSSPIFTHFIFLENNNEIYIKALTKGGEYSLFTIDMERLSCSYNTLEEELLWLIDATYSENIKKDMKKTIKQIVMSYFVLFASIIHDFSVPERREKIFNVTVPKRKSLPKPLKDDGPRIVYLPKILYEQKDCNKLFDQMQSSKTGVAKHYVTHCLRTITGKASNRQLLLARRHGINYIPDGMTFVSGYVRGGKEREIIYRSRSATKLLFVDSQRISSLTEPIKDWFKFEKDILNILEKIGFEVKHNSADRNGDGGIDIIAKEDGLVDKTTWFVQCKNWQKPIEAEQIKVMIATLSEDPGTRGMFVTSSKFRSGAIDLAKRHKIRLIDGDEINVLIDKFNS